MEWTEREKQRAKKEGIVAVNLECVQCTMSMRLVEEGKNDDASV